MNKKWVASALLGGFVSWVHAAGNPIVDGGLENTGTNLSGTGIHCHFGVDDDRACGRTDGGAGISESMIADNSDAWGDPKSLAGAFDLGGSATGIQGTGILSQSPDLQSGTTYSLTWEDADLAALLAAAGALASVALRRRNPR